MTDWLDYFTRHCARYCLEPQAVVLGSIAHKTLIVATHPAQIEGLSSLGWAQVRLHSDGPLESSLTMSRVYFGEGGSPSLDRTVCYELDLTIGLDDKSGSVTFSVFGETSARKNVYNRHRAAFHPAYARIVKLADGKLPPPRELIQKTIEAYVKISKR